jgi:hypothetical protein
MLVIGLQSRITFARCSDELQIEASVAESRKLRQRLFESKKLDEAPLDNCRSSRIRLQSSPGGWLLEFHQGHAKVTRQVQSLPVAAMWIESWLLSPAKPEDSATPAAAAASSEPSAGVGAMAPAVEAGSTLSVAPEGALWVGPELRGHAALSTHVRLEPHVGMAWPVTHRPDDTARSYRLGTSVGRVVYHTERLLVTPYADVSAVTLLWRDEKSGKELMGPAFGVGLAVTYRLYSSLRLVARAEGVAAFMDGTQFEEWHHWDGDGPPPSKLTEQRLEPAFLGVFGIGLQMTFGGGN